MVGLFRILLVLGGLVLVFITGKPLIESLQYKFTGETVEGRVIGFRGSGSSKTVFEDNTAKKHKGKRSRRPVFRYPIAQTSLDSLDGFSKSVILLPMFNYELNDKVSVVLDKNHPEKAHIFGLGMLLSDIVLVAFSFFMVGLGLYRRT